jgi:predicted phosphodiesterase
VGTRFSYIHLSDPHFCSVPVRQNVLTLMRRRPRAVIDTSLARVRHDFFCFAKPASYVPDIVSGVAQFCLERAAVVDGIIVTGDIATTGFLSDLNVGYAFLTEPAADSFLTERGLPTLGASKLPIYVLPGNHDKFWDYAGSPNCKNFELKFDGKMPHFDGGVGHWVAGKQERFLGFVYGDFCLLDRSDAQDKIVGVFGQGRVYEHILGELKSRTLSLRARYKGIHLVWVIHFAPFDCGLSLELIDWRDVEQAAVALGLVATLCGHTHKASKWVRDRHVIYCGGSAGCVDSEDDSRVHVVHFNVDESCVVSRESYKWDSNKQEFALYDVD